MIYAADFETTTDVNDCRVWAWALAEVGNISNFQYGTDITGFFDTLKNESNTLYFHNLKFDGEFILYWLYRNGYTYEENSKKLYTKSFNTLISDMGQWYSIKICIKRGVKSAIYLTIYDSLKILPFSVDKVAKAFNLPMKKLDIDYTKARGKNHKLTFKEILYIRNDVQIMALALQEMFSKDLKKMTAGSNALNDFKNTIGKKNFNKLFPAPSYDKDIRQSYRGGFTYLKPEYKEKTVGSGSVYDVNSLYPYVMYEKPLPYDEPLYFEGEYQHDDIYPLYIQMFSCQFELKKNHIPTLQLKNNLIFNPLEYLESSKDEQVTLCLTSVDMELFFKHYHVFNIDYHSGWKFKAITGIFTDYIDKWSTIKIESKQSGNMAMYTLSKLMLNSLYGKFATNPVVKSKVPVYDGTDDMIHFKVTKPEERTPVYLPIGTFITAYARLHTITAAQQVYDRFIYADTDSLHLIGQETPQGLNISDTKLGAWKKELIFDKARFIRAKTYLELGREPHETENNLKITCAGMPDSCRHLVNFDNFKTGQRYQGKLMPKHVSGGIVLLETEFTLNNKLVRL